MAKDIYHKNFVKALEKDGWLITDDPLTLAIGKRAVYVDVGAEKLIAAEKKNQKIAVEIKSFLRPSPIKDLEDALGQYILYRTFLKRMSDNRQLFLAIHDTVYFDFFQEEIAQIVIEENNLFICVFDPEKEEIVKWLT